MGNRFQIGAKIASGAYGDVYRGSDLETGKEVAIKLESVKVSEPKLLHEMKLYKILAGAVGVPVVHWYGVEGGHHIMVTDLLGPSLEDIFNHSRHNFSLKTVLMLADQMIDRVEYIHAKNLIHRDIKPGNFVMG